MAAREYKRLKGSNDQAPGYAMSRVYLETLADLPWNTFSAPPATVSPALPSPTSSGDTTASENARGVGGLHIPPESGSAAGSLAGPDGDPPPSQDRKVEGGEPSISSPVSFEGYAWYMSFKGTSRD